MRTKWECSALSALQKAKGTKLDCTLKSETDDIGVHSWKRKGTTWEWTRILFFNRIRVHSHVVPFASRSALRYGPFHYLECSPMWSLISYGMPSHMVRNNFLSALRFGPHHFQKCTLKWFSHIVAMSLVPWFILLLKLLKLIQSTITLSVTSRGDQFDLLKTFHDMVFIALFFMRIFKH